MPSAGKECRPSYPIGAVRTLSWLAALPDATKGSGGSGGRAHYCLAELKPLSAKDVDVDAGSGHRRGGRRYTADEDPASASSTVARPTAPSTLDIPSTSRPACAWSDRSGVNHLRRRVRSC